MGWTIVAGFGMWLAFAMIVYFGCWREDKRKEEEERKKNWKYRYRAGL